MIAKTEPAEPFLEPAPKRLAMLAEAMRADAWGYEDTWQATKACHEAGWPWERICRETFRLLLLKDSSPNDLRVMARDWTKRLRPVADGPAGPVQSPETAGLLRQAVETANAATAAQQARERNPGSAA